MYAFYNTSDIRKRIFYGLGLRFKAVCVHLNMGASLLMGSVLLILFYKIENNHASYSGLVEDNNYFNLIVKLFSVYSIFLIEKAGSFFLDSIHEQFEFDMIN